MKQLLHKKLWGHHITEALFACLWALICAFFALGAVLIAIDGKDRPTVLQLVAPVTLILATISYAMTSYGYLRRRRWSRFLGLAASLVLVVLVLATVGVSSALWMPIAAVVNYAADSE